MNVPRRTLLWLSLFLLTAPAWPQENPQTSPEDVAAGQRMFRSHCSACHGADGTGGRGTDLTRGTFRRATSDQDLYNLISEGIPGTEMPGIFFEGRQLWQLVAYVRSLGARAQEGKLAGDPVQGKKLFEGKGGCLQCHLVQGKGSSYGPDLSVIGARRSVVHLREALTRPEEKVVPAHFQARAVTNSGETITGIRLNEDTFSLQLRDSDGNLVSLRKQDLQEVEILKTSTMPSYQSTFSGTELDHVAAYLSTLRSVKEIGQ
jgi:putative heme-binding domain-containing protein